MNAAIEKSSDTIPWPALFIISAALLAYEVLLLRLLSIVQWHHFAFMVISLALLGHGISGVIISLCQRCLLQHFPSAFIGFALLFAILVPLSFWLTLAIDLNLLEIFWSSRQRYLLLILYAVLCLPFLCGSCCIALLLTRFENSINHIYACDLTAAACGIVLMISALYFYPPGQLIPTLPLLITLACCLSARQFKASNYISLPCLLALLLSSLLLTMNPFDSTSMQAYKPLSKTLQLPGSHIEAQSHSPLGTLHVINSPDIPLRHVSGLSLQYPYPVPEQKGLYIDGENAGVLIKQQDAEYRYLPYLSSSLAYQLIKSDNDTNLLLLGLDHHSLLQAYHLSHGAIDISERNPQLIALFTQDYGAFINWPALKTRVQIYYTDNRSFVQQSPIRYDLIQLKLSESSAAISLGLNSLKPQYNYTLQAFHQYWKLLTHDGLLSLSHTLTLPPQTALKLINTLTTLLKQQGISHPERHLLVIRNWDSITLLLSKSPLNSTQINNSKRFSSERGFDLVYYDGIIETDTNRYNQLRSAIFYTSIRRLLNLDNAYSASSFIDDYKFNIEYSTDNRPYFYHFFKWSSVVELIQLKDIGGAGLMNKAYPTLIFTFLMASIFSIFFIILPIFFNQSTASKKRDSSKKGVLQYFLLIGFAFMLLEITFINKVLLFIGSPLFSVALVIAIFLIFAGIGSACSKKLTATNPVQRLRYLLLLLALIIIIWITSSQWLYELLSQQKMFIRIAVIIAFLAPLAFLMGIPFPVGLSLLARKNKRHIPWAWAINGCASVIATVLATILTIHLGFNAVLFLALCLYLWAGMYVNKLYAQT